MNNSQISKFRPIANNHADNVKLLSELSKLLKPSVTDETYKSMKEALIGAYSKGKEGVEFKSQKQWAEDGFTIKPNMKAYMFWGSPKEYEKDGKMKKFFPVVYLFSSNQVTAAKN